MVAGLFGKFISQAVANRAEYLSEGFYGLDIHSNVPMLKGEVSFSPIHHLSSLVYRVFLWDLLASMRPPRPVASL